MRHLTIIIGLFGGVAWACGDSLFVCASHEQCARGDVAGVCQSNGYCSFPDDACASGQRYGDHAGKGLANSCVAETDPPAETSAGEVDDDDAAGTSGSGLTSESSGGSDGSDGGTSTSNTTTGVDETTTTSSYETGEGGEESSERTTGSVEPCGFEEHFESRTVPDSWMSGGDLDVVVQDEMLGMQLVSAETAKYGWAWTEPMNLSGRTVIAEVGSPPPPNSDGQFMLELTTPTLGFFMLIEGSQLLARTDDGDGYTTHASMPYDHVDARFLSMSDIGGAIRFAYSDDGSTWTTLHELPLAISLSSTHLAVVGGTWKQEANVGFVGFSSISVCP